MVLITIVFKGVINHLNIGLTMQTWQHNNTTSSFHHDVPLAITQMAAELAHDNLMETGGKTTKIHYMHHMPQEFLFVCFAISLAFLRV